MLPLMLVIHIFLGATVAGSLVVVALAMGYDTLVPILVAAAVGFFGAFPLSWYVAKKISALR